MMLPKFERKVAIMKYAMVLISVLVNACFSMDFTLHSDNDHKNYRFRVVDSANLSPIDYNNYLNHINDDEFMLENCGPEIAEKFKEELKNDLKAIYNFLRRTGLNRSQSTDWFIDCLEDNNAFVGELSLSTPLDLLQQDGQDTLEIGGSITSAYKGKGLASSLALPLLKKVGSFDNFRGKNIAFGTLSDNIRVHKLAEKCGFDYIGPVEEDFNFGSFILPLKGHLFTGKLR